MMPWTRLILTLVLFHLLCIRQFNCDGYDDYSYMLAKEQIPCGYTAVLNNYLGTGYDAFTGNPEGNSLFLEDVFCDPSLKPTSRILLTSDGGDTCPEEILCTQMVNEWQESFVVDDVNKYLLELQSPLSVFGESIHCNSSILRACSGNQVIKKQAEEALVTSKQVMLTKVSYRIFEAKKLYFNHLQKLDPEFVWNVCQLPRYFYGESKCKYFEFFRAFGTHVVVDVSLGEKHIERKFYRSKDYLKALIKLGHPAVTMDEENVTISSESTSFEDASDRFFPSEILKSVPPVSSHVVKIGSKKNLYPVKMVLQPIYHFLSKHYEQEFNHQACDHFNQLDNLQSEMKTALLSYMNSSSYVTDYVTRTCRKGFEENPWPKGTYSLLQPKEGCSRSGNWNTGSVLHATSLATDLGKYMEQGLEKIMKLDAMMDTNDLALHFCTHVDESEDENVHEWEPGAYCIFQSDCPSGFSESILPITGNYTSDNFTFDTVPEFSFPNSDTGTILVYNVCCRNDGTMPIALPPTNPFILLPINNNGGKCQAVYGMRVDIFWFAVTSITSRSEGYEPYTSEIEEDVFDRYGYRKPWRIYLCYYTPLLETEE